MGSVVSTRINSEWMFSMFRALGLSSSPHPTSKIPSKLEALSPPASSSSPPQSDSSNTLVDDSQTPSSTPMASTSTPIQPRARPKFAIASLSLGTNLYHTLPRKIEVAAELGYDGIEIFIPDFEAFVQEVGVGAHTELLGQFPAPAVAGPSETSSTTQKAAQRSFWSYFSQKAIDLDIRPRSLASLSQSEVAQQSPQDAQAALEIRCAQVIGDYCASLGLSIPVLQPFRDFENLFSPPLAGDDDLSVDSDGERRADASRLEAALARAERWLKLMKHLRTDLLLVCSNALPRESISFSTNARSIDDPTRNTTSFGPDPPSNTPNLHFESSASGSQDLFSGLSKPGSLHRYWEGKEYYRRDMVHSFRALGALAARYEVRIGYEALAWGTMVNRWEQTWDVVKEVNSWNVGVILDSFNQLAKIHADPAAPTGVRSTPLVTSSNLAALSNAISADPSKLFFYQIATATAPRSPIQSSPRAHKRMKWSRASRVFPRESDLLPVEEFTRAVIAGAGDVGGREGWWSLEVFNDSLHVEDPGVVESHARRGMVGLEALWRDISGGSSVRAEERVVKGSM